MPDQTLPLTGQMFAVANFANYEDERSLTTDIEAANVITSVVAGTDGKMHNVVIDLDLPATLLPSSTLGHFHLFIDKPMTWPVYASLLEALSAAGLVEHGYVVASLTRQHTAVRLPWIKKEKA